MGKPFAHGEMAHYFSFNHYNFFADHQSGGNQSCCVPPAAGQAIPQQQDPFPSAQTRPPLQENEHLRLQEAQHLLLVILL